MRSIIKLCVVMVLAVLLFVQGSGPAWAEPEESTPQADPAIWGVYTRLAGTSRQAGEDGYLLRWRWSTPGKVLVEEWIIPATGKLKHTQTITPRGEPGQLHMKASFLFGKEWDGTVQPDGSVLYVGKGFLNAPLLVRIDDANILELLTGKLRNGAMVNPRSTKYSRFAVVEPAESASVAGGSATGTNGPAPPAGDAATAMTAASLPAADASAQELEAAAAALLARASAKREAEAAVQQQAQLTEARAAQREAEAGFGTLEAVIGGEYVDDNSTLDIYAEDGGRNLVLQFGTPDGHKGGRYVLRGTAQYGVFEVLEHPPVHDGRNYSAALRADGALVLSVLASGTELIDVYRVEGNLLLADHGWMEKKPGSGWFSKERRFHVRGTSHYRPATEPALHLAAAQRERQERSEAEVKREKAESQRAKGRAFQAMLGNLSDYAEREMQTRAEADAMMARTRELAEQAAHQTQAAEKQRAEQLAVQQAASATQSAQAAEAPQPRVSVVAAAPEGAGYLTIEDKATRAPEAAPVIDDNIRETTMLCSARKFSSFEGRNGAVFTSLDAPARVIDGRLEGNPSERWVEKVEARYGFNVMGSCTYHDDPAMRQRMRRDWFNAYPHYKHVETGMTPL